MSHELDASGPEWLEEMVAVPRASPAENWKALIDLCFINVVNILISSFLLVL